MRNLRFTELILLSRPERAARRIAFHPRSTVIKGSNGTGKSSVLKSLYATLGAEPPKVHDKWKDANVISSLKFTLDDIPFRMIRASGRFSLFDGSNQLLGTYTSVSTQLAQKIAEMFAFHLLLRRKSEEKEVQATPAFLFLPFYIDQDTGWTDTLSSFARLQQFQAPKADVFAFHFGIKPSEYYAAKARVSQAQALAAPIRQERDTTERILRDLESQLQVADFNVDINVFRDEVGRLLERCQQLKVEEQQQRDRMSTAYAALRFATDQLALTRSTLDELRADREHAASLPGNDVECPICHTHYENGFAERFAIAVDEDRCIDLLNELDAEHRQAQQAYDRSREATERARSLVVDVEELLNSRREQLILRDVVRSEGRREMRGVVEARLTSLRTDLQKYAGEEADARADMQKYMNKERSKTILTSFRSDFQRLLQRLAVLNIPASSLKRPESPIRETGNALPRAVLAHFFASVKTIVANSTSALCPLVIDSPKQQDADEDSWLSIRQVINEERPVGAQLILATRDDNGTDFGGSVVELNDKYCLLTTSEFDAASDELLPLVEAALRAQVVE
jgi:hypothetical protein